MTPIVETMEKRGISEGLENLRHLLSSIYDTAPGEEEWEGFPTKEEKRERTAFLLVSGW